MRAADLVSVRVFAIALVALLAGYMLMGRGFAHLGVPPVHLGEVVLVLGVVATAVAVARLGLRVALSRLLDSRLALLLLAFMFLGLVRTVPYLETYGVPALRDAVLWGYGAFALIGYLVADRGWLEGTKRLYAFAVPVFAAWLPIAWIIFNNYQHLIPLAPGDVPVLFFKNQDMAVHTVGALAFVVIMWRSWADLAQFGRRFIVAAPLAWGIFATGSISRGAVAAAAAGIGLLALLAHRSPNWAPVLAAGLAVTIYVSVPGVFVGPPTSPEPTPSVTVSPGTPPPSGGPTATPTPALTPTPTDGRALTPGQWIQNIASVLFRSSDENLEGTKQFRLAWWGKIIDYTVAGPYFWDGKGFGINLADDDGFQPTADGSLRAPHNSHFTVLARMGVPGFVLWAILQVAFGISLLRATLRSRRVDPLLAGMGAWILVYWAAMNVNTSFDPYLEGPQGGIWFWTLFGLGLIVIRLTPRARAT